MNGEDVVLRMLHVPVFYKSPLRPTFGECNINMIDDMGRVRCEALHIWHTLWEGMNLLGKELA